MSVPKRNVPSTVLITGAAGYLGCLLRTALRGTPHLVRLTDVKIPPLQASASETFEKIDLADLPGLARVLQGVDTVFHFGGCSVEAQWNQILGANIIGTFNLFEASRLARVRRVVSASSHHVVGFYPRNRVIGVNDAPRPDSRYAVSKVFGEALGRLYADKHGLDVVCLRIGVVRSTPPNLRALSAWLSEDDFVRLCFSALSAPPVHFAVVYGVSANSTRFWTNEGAAEIGFTPCDDASAALSEVQKELLADDPSEVERKFQGGWYCGVEFSGDLSRIR